MLCYASVGVKGLGPSPALKKKNKIAGPQTLQSRFSEFAAHCTLINASQLCCRLRQPIHKLQPRCLAPFLHALANHEPIASLQLLCLMAAAHAALPWLQCSQPPCVPTACAQHLCHSCKCVPSAAPLCAHLLALLAPSEAPGRVTRCCAPSRHMPAQGMQPRRSQPLQVVAANAACALAACCPASWPAFWVLAPSQAS